MNIKAYGKVHKVFQRPTVIDKATNKEKAPEFAVQLLYEAKVKNSVDTKSEFIDIKIKPESLNKYKSMIGKDIEIISSLFSSSPIYPTEV